MNAYLSKCALECYSKLILIAYKEPMVQFCSKIRILAK